MRRLTGGLALAVILAALACGASGQAPPAPAPPAQAAPALTREQTLALENTRLKITMLQMQIQTLTGELLRQKAAIEAAHPGWSLNLDTLTLEKAPAPAKEPGP